MFLRATKRFKDGKVRDYWRIVLFPEDRAPETDDGSGGFAGSARTDVARPAPAEDLKRSCRRGEIDCVVKT